jgi:hypothetical protein
LNAKRTLKSWWSYFNLAVQKSKRIRLFEEKRK